MNQDTKAVFMLVAVAAAQLGLALRCAGITHAGDKDPTLTVLESFPRHDTDTSEDDTKRFGRIREIAAAINMATDDATERAALAVLAKRESGLAAYVYEDRCSDGPRKHRECDRGRARGVWQLHANSDHPEIPSDVYDQAKIAVKLWRGHRYRCASLNTDQLAGAFAGYATGKACSWGGAASRARETRRIAAQLWRRSGDGR